MIICYERVEGAAHGCTERHVLGHVSQAEAAKEAAQAAKVKLKTAHLLMSVGPPILSQTAMQG